jgi:hypothetical protein
MEEDSEGSSSSSMAVVKDDVRSKIKGNKAKLLALEQDHAIISAQKRKNESRQIELAKTRNEYPTEVSTVILHFRRLTV